MDAECAINEHLLLYIGKYISKHVFQVHSDIAEYIRDHEEEVNLFGGIFIKSHKYTISTSV